MRLLKVYKRKSNLKKYLITFLITMLFLAMAYYLIKMYKGIEINDNYLSKKVTVSTPYEQTVENSFENTQNNSDIIEEVTKGVCGISKLKSTGASILSTTSETELGLGTGIIVSDNGYILSNCHVTGEKYSTCYVTIEDLDTYSGTVVWADKDLDLSITKINAQNLPCVKLGSSDELKLGQSEYAIGNPIGYEFRKTVTSGIVSALNRTLKIEENNNTSYMLDLIQTDATINPGNSGGPLILANGDVIGINSVKITSAEGMGFAVPINVVKPIVEKFIQTGKFEEATLGIYGYDQSVAQYLNLSNKLSTGIYIEKVISSNSELKKGDVINKIDGVSVSTINDLKEYIYSKSPGDKVNVEITRNKSNEELSVVLGKK